TRATISNGSSRSRSAPFSNANACSAVSIATVPAARSSAKLASAVPWTNSAPTSTGTGRPGSSRVKMRPPARSRASSTTTERPASDSARAAASPAAPAPITTTSARIVRTPERSARRADERRGTVLAAPRVLRYLAQALGAALQREHRRGRFLQARVDRAERHDDDVVDHCGVDQKREQGVEEVADREVRAVQVEPESGEARLSDERRDQRRDQILHEGVHHRGERGADDDRDGEVDDVPARDELCEAFEHACLFSKSGTARRRASVVADAARYARRVRLAYPPGGRATSGS